MPTPAAQIARCSGPRLAGEHAGHDRRHDDHEDDGADHEAAGQITIRPWNRGRFSAPCLVPHPSSHRHDRIDHRRQASHDRDDSRGGDSAGADVADVSSPDLVGAHRGDEFRRFRRQRRGERCARPRDERRQDERGDDGSGDEDTGLTVAENETDAEQRRGQFHRHFGFRQHRQERMHACRHQERQRQSKLDPSAERHAAKNPGARRGAADRRPQHRGARGAFGIRQLVATLHDEQPSQRNHGRQTKDGAQEAERDDLEVRRCETPHEQRRNGEDRAARQRRRGGADGLR